MKKFKNAEEYTKYRYEIQEQQNKSRYNPYPHERPGPNKNSTQKTEIEPDIKLREFNYATRPVPDPRKFDWEGIKAVAISDNGKEGVIFVESDEGAIVVKGSQDAAIDFFLYKLQRVLNVSAPQMRVLRWYDKEFRRVISNLERATFIDETLGRRVKSRIDMAFLQVQEFIPGISISGMGPHRAALVFDHVTPESRDRLIRLGIIIAFDTLINNSDRYPLLWETEGNPHNILVKMKTTFLSRTDQLLDPNNLTFDFGKFYALDSGLSQINTNSEQGLKSLSRYYIRLESFVNELFMDMKDVMTAQIDPLTGVGRGGERKTLKSINKITSFIYEHTLYHMSDMQILQIMLGMIVGIENSCQLGIDRIEAMYQKFFLAEKDDWKGYWNSNLRRINLQMYNDCILIYGKFRGVYQDVIKWVKDITLNQYHLRIEEFEMILQGDFEDVILDTTNSVIDQNEEDKGDQAAEVNKSLNNVLGVDEADKAEDQEQPANVDLDDDTALHKRIKELLFVDLDQVKEEALKESGVQGMQRTRQGNENADNNANNQNNKSLNQSQISGNQPQQQNQINNNNNNNSQVLPNSSNVQGVQNNNSNLKPPAQEINSQVNQQNNPNNILEVSQAMSFDQQQKYQQQQFQKMQNQSIVRKTSEYEYSLWKHDKKDVNK